MMHELEEIIFADSWNTRAASYDEQAWLRIARHVVDDLALSLQRQLSLDTTPPISTGNGFSIDVRATDTDMSPWDLTARAIVGADNVDDHLLVRAWLFLYSGNLRIAPEGKFEYLELEYTQDAPHHWKAVGWKRGEPGEFDSFLTCNSSSIR